MPRVLQRERRALCVVVYVDETIVRLDTRVQGRQHTPWRQQHPPLSSYTRRMVGEPRARIQWMCTQIESRTVAYTYPMKSEPSTRALCSSQCTNRCELTGRLGRAEGHAAPTARVERRMAAKRVGTRETGASRFQLSSTVATRGVQSCSCLVCNPPR